jgi:dihydrofolate synthase/folylpolyglutamate synthase
MFSRYEEAVEWVNSLIPLGIKPGLARMEKLMELLGHPQRRIKFIHVAGTNGKGSTCAFIESVLCKAGYDVGSFTSPYLHRFTERIRYNGKEIAQADVLRLINELKPLAEQVAASELGSPTMFEMVTAMAIVYFAREACPYYVVWETGLGGLHDSTNVVTPIITAITNIGHDHQDLLGPTLTDIAAQKAGIIKAGVPLVSAVEQAEALDIIERTARDKKATLYLLGREFTYEPLPARVNEQVFHLRGPFRGLEQVTISLNGAFQMKNAALALMVIEVLRQYYALLVDDDVLYEAMRQTEWPGRLELVSEQPRIVLDGAHNPEGAAALVATLPQVYRYERLHVLVGMVDSKNHYECLRHILTIADTLIVTEPDFRKKMSSTALAEIALRVQSEQSEQSKQSKQSSEVTVVVEPDWRRALALLCARTKPTELALVTGSLYLLADVRAELLQLQSAEKGW